MIVVVTGRNQLGLFFSLPETQSDHMTSFDSGRACFAAKLSPSSEDRAGTTALSHSRVVRARGHGGVVFLPCTWNTSGRIGTPVLNDNGVLTLSRLLPFFSPLIHSYCR